MNIKKIIIVSLLTLMVLCCISSASAGLMKKETHVYVYSDNVNGSEGKTEPYLIVDLQVDGETIEDKTIEVTVEDQTNYKKNSYKYLYIDVSKQLIYIIAFMIYVQRPIKKTL